MFWNDWYGWQRNLWEDLSKLESPQRYRSSYPGVRLYSNENEAVVQAEVPGVSAQDLDIQVQDNELNIKLKRIVEEGEAVRRERPQGDYEKTVRLPFRANHEAVNASLKSGVLTVRMERAEEDKPRKIAVAAS
ncbi:MAG: Hsp20/alpha crystallin family protein [Leptospiraceae bacterium]